MKENNTKKKIISTSIKLITRKGIKDTSLSDIAKACNISKGTLYYYYSSKDKLISDIANIHLDAITNAVLECVLEVDINDKNDNMINLIIKKISKLGLQGKIHIYILCEAINSNEKLKEQLKIKYDHWRETLKKEVKKYYTDDDNAEALSFLLISIVDGLLVQSILQNKNSIDYENIANFLVTNLI